MTDRALSNATRAVIFATRFDEHPYATHGGTLFVVNFRDRLFGITSKHAFGDFPHEALLVTQEKQAKKGSRFAQIEGIRYPSMPTGEAVDTDIIDLCVVEFAEEVTPDFFYGTAFPLDEEHAATAKLGEDLVVFGMLKDATVIDGHYISVNWGRLEFRDIGSGSDPVLRRAIAEFRTPGFTNVSGMSGAPVSSATTGRLCGMVVRGGTDGKRWTIHYIDVFDIIQLVEAVIAGSETTFYTKMAER
jgi:hypothetical protein